MSELTFRPGPDIIAIEHIPEAQTSPSGIIVETKRTQKYPARGKVIAVGTDMSMDIKIGETVLYQMAIEEGIKLDGFTFDLALSQNILGVFPIQEDTV